MAWMFGQEQIKMMNLGEILVKEGSEDDVSMRVSSLSHSWNMWTFEQWMVSVFKLQLFPTTFKHSWNDVYTWEKVPLKFPTWVMRCTQINIIPSTTILSSQHFLSMDCHVFFFLGEDWLPQTRLNLASFYDMVLVLDQCPCSSHCYL